MHKEITIAQCDFDDTACKERQAQGNHSIHDTKLTAGCVQALL